MSNALMRETFDNWEMMVPVSKEKALVLLDTGHIEKTIDWLKDYRCPNGNSFRQEVYNRVADDLGLDEFVEKDNLAKMFNRAKCNGVPDYYLTNKLGNEMYTWLKEESGLMEQMQFRIFLGVRLNDFVDYLKDFRLTIDTYWVENKKDVNYFACNVFNSIGKAGLKPEHVMKYIIAPLFIIMW